MKLAIDNTFPARSVVRRRVAPALPASQWLRDVMNASKQEGGWDQEYQSLVGAVSSWPGLKGDLTTEFGPFVQATAANQPVGSASSFTSVDGTAREGITFDGANDCMTLGTLPACLPSGANPGSLWFIVSQDALASDATTRTLFAYGGTTAGTYRAIERRVVDGVNRLAITDGTTSLVDDMVDFSGVHFMRVWFDGTTFGYDLNGDPAGSAALVPATGTTIACLGINTAQNGGTWHGKIAQFALLAGDPTATASPNGAARYYYRP